MTTNYIKNGETEQILSKILKFYIFYLDFYYKDIIFASQYRKCVYSNHRKNYKKTVYDKRGPRGRRLLLFYCQSTSRCGYVHRQLSHHFRLQATD